MNREYKSDVFSMLLEKPEYALDVYNALNHTNYDDPDEVEIIHMEKGISLTIRNDASFIIDANMNLYEHQSTINPNMPFRNLIYITNILQGIVKKSKDEIFGRKKLQMPMPHFVVFYNGTENQPEEQILKLSDLFSHTDGESELELICRVVNINKGNSKDILKHSKVLYGYSYFVEKVREYQLSLELTEAISCALKDCVDNDVLADFFRENWQEVIKVTEIDCTFERQIEYEKNYSREEGKTEGKADSILTLLKMKGAVSSELEDKIFSVKKNEVLDELLKMAALASSVEAFETEFNIIISGSPSLFSHSSSNILCRAL